MERMVLERNACEVEISGRRFLLEEMSGSDVERFCRLQVESFNRAISDLRSDADVSRVEGQVRQASDELTVWLLSRPADGGEPADEALLTTITLGMRHRLVEVQERLNDLEHLPGNSLSRLWRRLTLARLSQTATSDGPRSSTP